MYNRYIPQPDGTYRRDPVKAPPPVQPEPPAPEPEPPVQPCPPPKPQSPPPGPGSGSAGDFLRRLLPQGLDVGDLIVILLLLLMAGDCQEDRNHALLTLAIYLFL